MEYCFCLQSYEELLTLLHDRVASRLFTMKRESSVKKARTPIGLVFVRPRSDEMKTSIDQKNLSYSYWNNSSGSAIDFFFPGWDENGMFNAYAFSKFEDEFRSRTRWQPMGETTILLMDLEVDLDTREAELDLSRTLILPVADMVEKKKVKHLDDLIVNLTNAAKVDVERNRLASIWEISNLLAWKSARARLIQWIEQVKYLEFAAQIFNDIRPYAICDLRKKA